MKILKFNNGLVEDIILLTVCDDIKKAEFLTESAKKYKWNLVVLIPFFSKWNNIIKIKSINQYFSDTNNDSKFVFFVDAYDVIIQNTPQYAIEVLENIYKLYNKKIIINDDSYYRTPHFLKNIYHFPRPNSEWGNYDLSENNFIYKHNTGLILAFKDELHNLYKNILEKCVLHNFNFNSDQKLFGKIYQLYPYIFNNLHKSRDNYLHHTGYFPNTVDLFDNKKKKIVLKNGIIPLAIHTNGKENNDYRLQQFNHINNKLNNTDCLNNCIFCKKKRFISELNITIKSVFNTLKKGNKI